MRCAIYARKSTDGDGRRKEAGMNGWLYGSRADH